MAVSAPRFRLVIAAIACGLLPGCYIPNGGWTLRTGLDLRTHKKPSCFLEMVDTRWDEWNRIAEMNAMQAACDPSWAGQSGYSYTARNPPPPGESDPYEPPVQDDSPPPSADADAQAAVPAGAWLFRR